MTVIIVGIIVAFVMMMAIINRYRRCPSDKILVVYGTTGNRGSAKCVHGGGTFVWPIIQDYAYLSLTPISIDANLTNALSRQNIRVDVPCRFTVGISTDPECMNNAAERLLGQTAHQIQELARDILFGQLRLVIATMSIEELNSDRDKFLDAISSNVEVELKKIGLVKDFSEIGKYMWHGGAHHVGFDTHDLVEAETIQAGMMFCVDIGIYVEEWGIGFRVEDNCLVTEDGCENLTYMVPRTIEEIEAVMAK